MPNASQDTREIDFEILAMAVARGSLDCDRAKTMIPFGTITMRHFTQLLEHAKSVVRQTKQSSSRPRRRRIPVAPQFEQVGVSRLVR